MIFEVNSAIHSVEVLCNTGSEDDSKVIKSKYQLLNSMAMLNNSGGSQDLNDKCTL